jgi:hypothetical protein
MTAYDTVCQQTLFCGAQVYIDFSDIVLHYKGVHRLLSANGRGSMDHLGASRTRLSTSLAFLFLGSRNNT